MDSALYTGWVRHNRRHPKSHRFSYPMGLVYLDLDELPQLESELGLGKSRWTRFSFCRKDYHGPVNIPLKQAVQDTVFNHLQQRLTGPVRLLTQPRVLGLCFNPVSFYYAYDQTHRLAAVVAEITNTPWKERHCYVLPVKSTQPIQLFHFEKDFHVSPFMPMRQAYTWRFRLPDEKLMVHMENWQGEERVFSASLSLKRQALNSHSMRSFQRRFFLQGHKVLTAIYWQALKLKFKGIPFYDHPKHQTTAPAKEGLS